MHDLTVVADIGVAFFTVVVTVRSCFTGVVDTGQ
jgi:hypothetical protein